MVNPELGTIQWIVPSFFYALGGRRFFSSLRAGRANAP
jgi:hypothetical protein